MSETKPKPIAAPSPPPPKRSKLRWALRQTRRLIVLLGIGLLLFVMGFGLYAWEINYRGEEAVRKIESELSRRGLLDLFPQALFFEEEYKTEDGTSAAYWRAAMNAQPDVGKLPIPLIATVNIADIELCQQYHPDTVAAMREAVDSNTVFFDLVSQAQSAELGRFIVGDETTYLMNGLPNLRDTRGVARWLLVRANFAEAEGDGDLFTESLLSILNLNKTLQLDPSFMSKLVVLSIDAMARQGVTDGLSRITLNEIQLDRLLEAFKMRREQYDLAPLLGTMLSSEFHQTTAILQHKIAYWEAHQRAALHGLSHKEKKDMEGFLGFSPEKNVFVSVWGDATLAWCPGTFQLKNVEKMKQAIATYDQIKAVENDVAKRWELIDRLIQNDDDDESISLFDIRGRMTDTIDVAVTARTVTRFDNSLATAIAALRIERYRVSNNAWPATLVDAIGEVPLDLYGQPLQYRATAEGVIVYSIGPNGLDEEGYGQHDYAEQKKYQDPDDFAVRLYNPDLRNAIPPPAEAVLPEEDYDW